MGRQEGQVRERRRARSGGRGAGGGEDDTQSQGDFDDKGAHSTAGTARRLVPFGEGRRVSTGLSRRRRSGRFGVSAPRCCHRSLSGLARLWSGGQALFGPRPGGSTRRARGCPGAASVRTTENRPGFFRAELRLQLAQLTPGRAEEANRPRPDLARPHGGFFPGSAAQGTLGIGGQAGSLRRSARWHPRARCRNDVLSAV